MILSCSDDIERASRSLRGKSRAWIDGDGIRYHFSYAFEVQRVFRECGLIFAHDVAYGVRVVPDQDSRGALFFTRVQMVWDINGLGFSAGTANLRSCHRGARPKTAFALPSGIALLGKFVFTDCAFVSAEEIPVELPASEGMAF